jgi:ribulose bisphosphate carboxylase small subunit
VGSLSLRLSTSIRGCDSHLACAHRLPPGEWLKRGLFQLKVALPSLIGINQVAATGRSQRMSRVVIGMDPHKRSATIEAIDQRENILTQGRAGSSSSRTSSRKHSSETVTTSVGNRPTPPD